MFCPYINNKQVVDGFNEMVQAFGGRPMTKEEFKSSSLRNQRTGLDLLAMKLAYDVYNKNNGNFLDKTPDGQQSELFQKILQATGSRPAAMALKSTIYSSDFEKIYGNIQEIGEPKYEQIFRQTDVQLNKVQQDFSTVSIDLCSKPEGQQLTSDTVFRRLARLGVIMPQLLPLFNVLGQHQIPILLAKLDSGTKFIATRTDENGNSYIVVDPQRILSISQSYFADKLLHEVVHAITVPMMDKPKTTRQKRFAKLAEQLCEQLKSIFYIDGRLSDYSQELDYALSSPKELVAEFLVNEEVRRSIYDRALKYGDKSLISNIKEFVNSITRALFGENLFNTPISQVKLLESQLKRILYNAEKIQYQGSDVQKMFQQVYDSVNEDVSCIEGYDTTVDKFLESLGTFQTNYAPGEEHYSKSALRKLNDTFREIQQHLDTRLRVLDRLRKQDVSNESQFTITRDQLDKARAVEITPGEKIISFIQPILPQLQSDLDALRQSAASSEVISAEQYNNQLHDNLNVYLDIFEKLSQTVDNYSNGVRNGLIDELGQDAYNELVNFINRAKTVAQNGVNLLSEQRILIGQKLVRQYGEEVGGSDLVELADQLGTPATKDTSWFIKSLGFISGSNNKILNFISGKITKAINIAKEQNKSIGNKLINLQGKLKFGEKVTDLYERLSDGSFSQNLIRKLNFGQLQKDYKDFIGHLQSKYGLSDEELEYGPEDEAIRKKFYEEKNKWLEQHAIRRYKSQYYEAFQSLSPQTQAARRAIQAQINDFKRICTDKATGRPDYSKLTKKQWEEFQVLLQQKRMLGSIYDSVGNLKTGESLKIALEIQQLNEKLYGDTKSRRANSQAWLNDREKIIEQCGGREKYESGDESFDFKKLEEWDRRNSRSVLKFNKELGKTELELYIDKMAGEIVYELMTKDGLDGGAEYKRLTDKRNQLLAPYRNNFGEIGLFRTENKDVLPGAVIAQISDIDKQLSKIRRLAKNRAKKTGDKLFLETLERRKALRESIVEKKATQAYNDLVSYYMNMYGEDPQLAISVINRKTRVRLYSVSSDNFEELYGSLYQWYTKSVVKPEYAEQFAELVPNDNYIDDTVKSDLLDERFDEWEGQGEYLIPRTDTPELKARYDNSKQYDKVDKREGNPNFSQTLYDLYQESLKVIEDSNNRYGLPHRSKYLLPGITISNLGSLYYRDYKMSKAFKYIRKNCFGLREREDSDLFGEDVQKQIESGEYRRQKAVLRPDGTELHMIPKYYSNKLRDPFAVSRNLVEILSKYDKQSRLFEQRRNIEGDIQVMLDILQNEYAPVFAKNGTSNSYQAAKDHVTRRLYDIKYTGTPEFARLAKLVQGLTSALNLGFNKAVALTGFLTTSTAHLINALTGYRYGIGDMVAATKECVKYVSKRLFGILDFANRNSKNKQIKLMEYFDLGGQYESKMSNTSDAYLVKLFKENYIWGMLKLQDNAVKMSVMIATLHSFRLVNGEFITKEDIIRKNWKDDYAKQEQLAEYRHAKNLYELLYVDENGDITIADEYKQQYDRVKDAVINRVQTYSENADGVATESQKAAITTGFLGSAALMHRQYFPLMLQERWGETVYNVETRQWSGGIFRNAAKLLISAYVNMFKRITGDETGPTKWSFESALNCFMVCGMLTFQAGMPIFLATSMFSAIAGLINGENYNKMFNAHKNKESDEREAQLSITRQYQLKQIRWELAVTQLLIYPIATLINALADSDDDRDDRDIQFWAYVSARTQWETFNPYRFSDALQQFHSVTAVTGTLDKLEALANSFGKILSPKGDLFNTIFFKGLNTGSDSEVDPDGILFSSESSRRSGTYSVPIPILSDIVGEDMYFTKLGQTPFELTPFSNTYRQSLNSKRSRQYYRNQVMKDNEYREELLYQYFDSELVDPINDYLHQDDY